MKTKDTREPREQTDAEALALSKNKGFWKVIDEAIARGEKEASLISRIYEAGAVCMRLTKT